MTTEHYAEHIICIILFYSLCKVVTMLTILQMSKWT